MINSHNPKKKGRKVLIHHATKKWRSEIMKREQLEKYLNKKVKIHLSDGDKIEGYLRKTGEADFKNNLNLYIPKNYYFLTDGTLNCISCVFRVSHVVKIL